MKAHGSLNCDDDASTRTAPISNCRSTASEQISVPTVNSDVLGATQKIHFSASGAQLKAPPSLGSMEGFPIIPDEDPPHNNVEHTQHSDGLLPNVWSAGRPPSSSGSVGGSSAGTGSLMRMADALEALAVANNWNLSAPRGIRGSDRGMMRGSSQSDLIAEDGEPPWGRSMAAEVTRRAPSTTRATNERMDSVGGLPHEDCLLVDILMQVRSVGKKRGDVRFGPLLSLLLGWYFTIDSA